MVATNHEAVLFLIVKYESENTVNLLEKIHSLVAIERKDNFAVRTRLEIIFSLISFANLLMIVNFTVHSQHLFAVGSKQRLFARLRVNYRQTFMGKNGGFAAIYARPVGSAMTQTRRHFQNF